jgi:hypothetical protein
MSSADYIAFMKSIVIFLRANITVMVFVKRRSHISFCIDRIFIPLAVSLFIEIFVHNATCRIILFV